MGLPVEIPDRSKFRVSKVILLLKSENVTEIRIR